MLFPLALALASSPLTATAPSPCPPLGPQFGPKVSVTGGIPGSAQARARDVDGDGDEDLVVASSTDRALVWMEQVALTPAGPQPIEFSEPQLLLGGLNLKPFVFEFFDVDQDGVDDVLVGGTELTSFNGAYVWSKGLATGGFAPPTLLPDVVHTFNGGPKIYDVDGDGDLDVVLARQLIQGQYRAGWLENQGGTFAPIAALSGSVISSFSIEVADFDGDGDMDIAGSFTSGPRPWYRNTGGSFTLVLLPGNGGVLREPLAVDLDGDGDNDLVYAPPSGAAELLIYENVGGPAQFQIAFEGMPSANNLIAIDADLDGDLDLVGVWANVLSAELPALINDGAFGFDQVVKLTPNAAPPTFELHTGDLNGDGITDLVLGSLSNRVSYLLGDTAGTPTAFEPVPVTALGSLRRIQGALPADVDGDGDTDLIVARHRRVPFLSRNLGASLLLAPAAADVGPDTNFTVEDALDVDGDGVVDIVGVRPNENIVWGRGRGDGSFEDPALIAMKPWLYADYALADFEGDGDLDLTLPGIAGDAWVVMEQTAPGVFAAARALPDPGPDRRTEAVAVGDVTGDGLLDLVQGAADKRSVLGNSTLTVFRGLGGGTFDPVPVDVIRLSFLANTQRIKLADLDRDGDLDPIWSQLTFSGVYYAENLGGGQLGEEVRLFTNNNSPDFLVGDVDLDGFPDVFASAGGRQWFAHNRGGMLFDEAVSLGLPAGQVPVWRIADLDQDGDLDLVSSYVNNDEVAYFPGTAIQPIGADVCGPGIVGSSGLPAELIALGSADPATLDLRLRASRMPALATAILLASLDRDVVPGAGGGLGTLCLGGPIGRFASSVQVANQDGTLQLDVDVTALPQPTGSVPALAGQTWRFQAWFQDSAQGQPTSNFTSAVQIDF